MKRQDQLELVAATLAFSWLAMQAVHEFGHIVAAVVSGGRVVQVILHPTTISMTRLTTNPHPLFVAWMGPIVGSVLPLIFSAMFQWRRWRGWYAMQFFAGFCLIANGAYLAFGSFARIRDAGGILRYHAPIWLLWLFGAITIPIGLWLWNDLGSHFGFGPNKKPIDRGVAHFIFACTVAIVVLEIAFSSSVATS